MAATEEPFLSTVSRLSVDFAARLAQPKSKYSTKKTRQIAEKRIEKRDGNLWKEGLNGGRSGPDRGRCRDCCLLFPFYVKS